MTVPVSLQHQGAVGAARMSAGERLVVVVRVRHDCRAARERQQLAAQAEDRPRGHRTQAPRFAAVTMLDI